MSIDLKRAYDPPADDDGCRVLVDRVWPRGVAKDDLEVDAWLKEVAPNADLRKWFGHDPKKWGEFKKRYAKELEQRSDAVEELVKIAKAGHVTLVFGEGYRAQQRGRPEGAARAPPRAMRRYPGRAVKEGRARAASEVATASEPMIFRMPHQLLWPCEGGI